MKRTVYYLWIFLVLAGVFTSCSEEHVVKNGVTDASVLTISLSTADLDSRATATGVNELNENKVEDLVCFIYLNNEGTQNADYVKEISVGEADASTPKDFTVNFSAEEIRTIVSTISGTGNYLTLYAVANPPSDFPKNGTIASIKKHQLVDSEFSTFSAETPVSSFVMDGQIRVNLSMNANSGLEFSFPENGNILYLTRAAAKIELNVHVIENLTVTDDESEETVWTPDLAGMQVSFHNGVKYGYIDAGEDGYLRQNANMTDYFFDREGITFGSGITTYNEKEYHTQTIPFYSYPFDWNEKANEQDSEPYLTLVVPWTMDGDEVENKRWVNYYYQIPINSQDENMLRNHVYQIYIDVEALGSPVPTESVELTPSYIIMDWNKHSVYATLKQYRFLIAEQNAYEMNNVDEFTFSFITSHECILNDVKVMKDDIRLELIQKNVQLVDADTSDDYNEGKTLYTNNNVTPCSANVQDSEKLTVTLNNETMEVTIKHILDNDTNIGQLAANRLYDYQPITIQIEIAHADKNEYKETFTVVQYPMIYVEAEPNERLFTLETHEFHDMVYGDYAAKYEGSISKTNEGVGRGLGENRGWVFVNGHNEVTPMSFSGGEASAYNWDLVRGCYDNHGSSNQNPNMYIVTVTALEKGSPYILGDPRTGQRLNDAAAIFYDAENTTWDASKYYGLEDGYDSEYWARLEYQTPGTQGTTYTGVNTIYAPAIDGSGNRRLTYYNPTRTDNGNYIAPKFRIASSYSKLMGDFKPRIEMLKRCATYQEHGYPAGRWRLPTEAELQFMLNLSVEGKIPHLFSHNNGYWTATKSFVYRQQQTDENGNITADGYIEEWMGGTDSYSNGFTSGQPINRGVVRPVYDDWYWGNEKCNREVFTWGDRQ